jgi:hypothetical protein
MSCHAMRLTAEEHRCSIAVGDCGNGWFTPEKPTAQLSALSRISQRPGSEFVRWNEFE